VVAAQGSLPAGCQLAGRESFEAIKFIYSKGLSKKSASLPPGNAG